jgi:hypothetical protein
LAHRIQAAGAWKVLDDHIGLAWNMSAQVTGQQTPVGIITAAGRKSDNEIDGFTFVEAGSALRMSQCPSGGQGRPERDCAEQMFQGSLPMRLFCVRLRERA